MNVPSSPQSASITEEQEWLEVVRQKVARLRFGSVQITVHEGRVTQVESVEKTRFLPKTRDGQES
jgi:hypothetical protein